MRASIVTAFDHDGVEKLPPKLGNGRSRARRETVLAQMLATAEA